MKLTKEQIADIKAFISKRGIAYLDVQMEVLDHVASQVEEKLTDNPNLSFDTALKQTHASFGIFGFSVIEDSIVNTLGKKYRNIFWSNFLMCFNLKHILLVIFGGFLLYQLQVLLNDNQYFMTIWLIAIIALVGFLVIIILNFKPYKKLLVYRTSIMYFVFMGSFLQIFNYAIKSTSNTLICGIYSNFFITSTLLVLFIIYVISAIRTAKIGVKESKLLMEKYAKLK